MNNRDVTIQDVAEKAEVSIATVSRVLNHKEGVKNVTCDKVFTAIQELGYQVKENWKHLIVLNLPNISNPFYHEITKGIMASSFRNGYKVLLNISDNENMVVEDLINVVEAENASGVIVLNNMKLEELNRLKRRTKVVQCCDYCENSNVPYVSIDEEKAVKSAMDYITSNNRKKIAFVNGSLQYKYAQERLKYYRRYITNHNLLYRGEWVLEMPKVDYDLAVSAITQMLASENKPDAIFTVSDIYAAAAVKAAYNAGIEIKKDLSIVGFGNIDISRMCIPAITTINQPKYVIGCHACELLIEMIKNPFKQFDKVILDTELIIRET